MIALAVQRVIPLTSWPATLGTVSPQSITGAGPRGKAGAELGCTHASPGRFCPASSHPSDPTPQILACSRARC